MATNDGLLISTTAPTDAVTGAHTWLKVNVDGSREWYESSGAGGWSLIKTEFAPATATHTHSEFSGEFDGTFKKITIVNGIVTDFELDE
jgi:hypothetical protein